MVPLGIQVVGLAVLLLGVRAVRRAPNNDDHPNAAKKQRHSVTLLLAGVAIVGLGVLVAIFQAFLPQ